jgi:hypothetical protein
MFELISKTDVMPRSLRITDLRTVDVIDMGDSESRSTGAHKGRSVSLKVIDRAHHRDVSALPVRHSQYLIHSVRLRSEKSFIEKS